jgi:CAAX protease family protein
LSETAPASAVEERSPEFEGSWEKSGRSPVSAAILGFIIIGIVYVYAQGFIGFVILAFQHSQSGGANSGVNTILDVLTAKAVATKNPIRYSVFISEFIFMLVPTIWIIRRWHTKDFLRYIRFRKVPGTEILLAVAASLFFFPASSAISDFFLRELNFPDFLMRINSELFTSYTPGEFFWVILVVCVTPAICEETLFRGYFQRTLERTIGAKSIVIAGILFGLYHMRPLNLVSLSLLGMMIGFFFYRSKSILPGIAAHFTNNFVAVLSVYRLPDGRPRIPFLSSDAHFPLLVLATIVCGIAIFYYYYVTKRNFLKTPIGDTRIPENLPR